MVHNKEQELDLIFHALADSTRRDILKRLATGDLGVSELASTYDMSLTAVSKHLRVLEKASLVTRTKEGRVQRCTMRFESVEKAYSEIGFYKRFWQKQLDGLEQFVQKTNKKKKKGYKE